MLAKQVRDLGPGERNRLAICYTRRGQTDVRGERRWGYEKFIQAGSAEANLHGRAELPGGRRVTREE
jgi:hypothetical protein